MEMKTTLDYNLFKEINVGANLLKNRVVMAPLTRCRAIDHMPNDLMATYYSQRAGAGLIITEGTSPSINGLGYARMPGIINSDMASAWQPTARKVHDMGGKIFMQLMHSGRVSHPENLPKEARILAPSSVKLNSTKMHVDGKGDLEIPAPVAMTISDIEDSIEEFRLAAQRAIDNGFDGVEIHGANGYLIDQFTNKASNKRTDEYGGSIQNRSRFLLDVVTAVKNQIGAERVGVRLSPFGVMNEMEIYDEMESDFVYIATQLNRLDVAYIHLADHSSMGAPDVPNSIKSKIRTVFNNAIILCGGYNKETAERDISKGLCDLVAFGRPYIANPDLAGRMAENARLAIPDTDTFYTPDEKGYIDYPYLKVESISI